MSLNSISFLLFLSCFFLVYWNFGRTTKIQNALLLAGSYLFYGCIDWRFLCLLVGASVLNFLLGLCLERKPGHRKLWLFAGLLQGAGGLAFFKYTNFFISSFTTAFHGLGFDVSTKLLEIGIPLGISFYTFRTISYLLDVDKGKIRATTDWVAFFTYIAFFPCMLSGPIDKARDLLPQLGRKRKLDPQMAADGLRQILWGLFKKTVIADNCATITSSIFEHQHTLPGSTLLIGAFFYTIQLYADFSGYSDMAIGASRLIGLEVTQNFNFPFFAQNIADFWRRWHISLTSWFTEYVFTPLSISFRDYGTAGLILVILLDFSLIGLWHGANWTYLVFGLLHGIYFIPLILKGTVNKKKKLDAGVMPSAQQLLNMTGTFVLVMLTFIVFRSENISAALFYYQRLFSTTLFSVPNILTGRTDLVITLFFTLLMITIEWFGKANSYAVKNVGSAWPKIWRWSFYYSLLVAIFLFAGLNQHFIYIQF